MSKCKAYGSVNRCLSQNRCIERICLLFSLLTDQSYFVFCEGTAEARFNKTNTTSDTNDEHEDVRDFFNKYGFSIEQAVRVLFEGLVQEKLYVGPIAFQKQSPKILEVI